MGVKFTNTTPETNLATEAKLQNVVNDLKRLNALTVVILVVVAIAAGGLLTNHLAAKQASYESLKDQVQAQNAEIQVLTNQLKNSTITPKQ